MATGSRVQLYNISENFCPVALVKMGSWPNCLVILQLTGPLAVNCELKYSGRIPFIHFKAETVQFGSVDALSLYETNEYLLILKSHA